MRFFNLRVLFLILSVSITTQAQDRFVKGHYVSTANDTIRGWIKYRDSYLRQIIFKTDRKAQKQTLGENEVRSFAFENGQTYELVNFADKNAASNLTYARKVGGDVISLYYSHGQFLMGSEEKSYFIIRKGKVSNSGEAMTRHQKNVGALNVLFNDCPEVKEKAGKTGISEELLLDQLEEYHKCKSTPFKNYSPVSRKLVGFGVFAGVGRSELTLTGNEHFEGTTFNPSTQPIFGLIMTITPSKKASSIFSMQMELLYTSMNFEGTYSTQREVSGYYITINSSTTVESQIIMPRVGFRLAGRSNVANPYFSAGVSVPHIAITDSYDTETVTINNGSETTESEDTIQIGTAGFWLGAGLKKNVGKKSALFMDVTANFLGLDGDGTALMLAPRLGFMF
jgi:hypothetical protein